MSTISVLNEDNTDVNNCSFIYRLYPFCVLIHPTNMLIRPVKYYPGGEKLADVVNISDVTTKQISLCSHLQTVQNMPTFESLV